MRTIYLKLLVGLFIVFGVANAGSSAAANTRMTTSPGNVEVNLRQICFDCDQECAIECETLDCNCACDMQNQKANDMIAMDCVRVCSECSNAEIGSEIQCNDMQV